MKTETFTELLGSAHEALEHAQGKRNLRTTTRSLERSQAIRKGSVTRRLPATRDERRFR